MTGPNVAGVLAAHRVNYHHRNVGGETAESLRYTSCDGCDWLGGWHDEAGWEAHVAAVVNAEVARWLADFPWTETARDDLLDALAEQLAPARGDGGGS